MTPHIRLSLWRVLRVLRGHLKPHRLAIPHQLALGLFVFAALTGVFYTRVHTPTHVYAATSSTLNFQARLTTNSGGIVPDGNYSVQFKLYDAVSGGANEWTETQGTVAVKSGYLSVYLGSVTPFASTIDWSQEHWLTMNVNGDGEMSPRLKLTAVPYAFRAGIADSLSITGGSVTGDNLAQLAPAGLQTVNSTVAGLRINQTGSGGLIQFASGGTDRFTVSNGGNGAFAGILNVSGSTLTVGTSSQTGLLVLQDGSGGNSSFQASSGGLNITSGGNVTIGTSNTTGTLLVLDTKTDAIDPTGVDGAMYYNSNLGKFRCYQNGQWQNCIAGDSNATTSFVAGLANAVANTAGQAAEEMVFTSATGVSVTVGPTGFTAPANGSFRSCLVKNNANITAGTLSLRWRVNGASVGAAACTMNATTNRQSATALDSGVVTFTAGDTIDVAIDTNAAYAPATNDYTIYWTVEYNGTPSSGGPETLQSVYDNSSTPELVLDASRGALTIRDNATPIAANLFEVQNNAGTTTFFDVSANGITAGAGDVFSVNALGDITSSFTALNGTSTANGAGANATNLVLANAANFDVGNYVQVNSANCGGAGVNPCYAKITAKAVNTLTITPALSWANGSTVNEYHVPEIGGIDTSQALANRYGRGYFIAGVAAGNGTTYYNEDSIESSLSTFSLLDTGVTTLNIGGAATSITLGTTGTAVDVAGSLTVAGTSVIGSGGALTNISSITGSGALSIASGGAGDISFDSASGIMTIAANDTTLQRTAAGTYTIDLNDAGTTTLSLNNTGAGAASLNLVDGGLQVAGTSIVTNGGALQNLTGITQTSGNFSQAGAGTFSTATGTVSLNGNTSVASGRTFSVSGATTISPAGNGEIGLAVNGTTGTAATAATINQTGNAANLTLINSARTAGALVSMSQTTSAFTGTGLLLNFANGSGSFSSGDFADFQVNGVSRFSVNNNGGVTVNGTSTTALDINNASGAAMFGVDSSTGLVFVGATAADANQVLFQLDSFSTRADTATCTTATNQGAMYYNTNSNSIRACINATWEDMVSTSGLGIMLFGVVPDSGNNPGDLPALATAGASGPCKVSRGTAANQFSIAPCVAYSRGRKVVVTQQTNVAVTGLTTTNIWAHICLTGTDDQPVLSAAANTETATANLPTWSANNPILCLADIRGSATVANNIAQIYDIRTFTNTQKEFVTQAATVPALGQFAVVSGANVTQSGASTGLSTVVGIVVATNGTASTTNPTAIIATSGPAYVKATLGSAGGYVQTTTTAGYANTAATSSITSLGQSRTTFNGTCTSAATCLGSMYLNLKIKN